MTKHYSLLRRYYHKYCAFLLLLFLCSVLSTQSQAQGYVHASRLFNNQGSDVNRQLVADINGNTYLLANMMTTSFAVTIPGPGVGAGWKGVLLKLDPNGNILWSRYLPHSITGTGTTDFVKMVLDNGKLYLLGYSNATDVPVTNGKAAPGGTSDILYASVDANSGALLSNVYLGGSGAENTGYGIKAENGSVYVTYTTTSADIPTTTGPAFTSGYDHIVQKLAIDGTVLYSTYTGSTSTTATGTEETDLQVENGIVALAVQVSNVNTFVTTDGSVVKGTSDFGLVKLDGNGNKLYSILYGGTLIEKSPSLVLKNGEVYLAGLSTSGNYPVTDGTSFTGQAQFHVITKFNTAGSRLFSSIQAGLSSASFVSKIKWDNGSVYLHAIGTTINPVINATDGSAGGIYIIRLNAANGQPVFATCFGLLKPPAGAYSEIAIIDGSVVSLTSGSGGGAGPVTDGSVPKLGPGGSYLVVYSTDGKQRFASWRMSGTAAGGPDMMAVAGNKLFFAGSYPNGTSHLPVTFPITGAYNSNEMHWMGFTLCPPMPTQNDIAPLSQTICSGGFTQALSGNKVAFESANMPTLMRQTVLIPQQEISARYQWQVSLAAAGPWTNIPGAGTLKDYSPPSLAETRYYRRVVLPALGCGDVPISTSAVAAVIVGANLSPDITSSIYNTCAGTPVDITATVSGGATPYIYAWDNGVASVTNSATVTPATNSVYTLTVTDNNGCEQKGQVVVNAYAADAGPATVSSCAGKPVRLGTAPPAGLAGVVYAWSPATGLDDPNIAQPLATPAGNTVYTLTMTIPITGGGTCNTSDNVTVNVVAGPTTVGFAGPDKAICKGGTTTLGTPLEPIFAYAWSPGNYLSAVNASSVTFDAGTEIPSPNPFTYTLTASQGGCSFTDDVAVTILVANAGEDLCGPRTVGTPDPIPHVTGKTFLWEVVSGTGTITGATNTPTTTVSGSTGGNTTYRLTVSYLGVSCTDLVVVPECGSMPCPLTGIEVVAKHGCPSTAFGAVTLSAKPATLLPSDWTYTWSSIPAGGLSSTTGHTITLTDNVERDVTLTITSVNNPSFSCSQSIHVNGAAWSLPVFNAQNQAICAATSVNIGESAVAGYSYKWTNVAPLDVTFSNPSVAPALTTSYYVTVTDASNGCTTTDTAKVTVKPVIADPGADWTTCSSALVQLGSPARAGYTYSWTPAVASYQNGTDNFSAEPKVLVATSQDFTVRVTDTETGCFKDSTVHIVIDGSSTLPAMANQTICRGASVQIGSPAVTGATYSWSPAAGLSSATVAQPFADPASTQTYTLVVTYYDASNAPACTKNGTVTVTVNGPEVAMSNDVVCPSGALYNLGTGVTQTGASTYAWTPSSRVSNPTILGTTVSANPLVPQIYTLTVTDVNGCTATASKTVSPTNAAPIAGSNSQVCVGSNVTLGSASNTGIITWTVSPATTVGALSSTSAAAPVFTPAAGDAGKVFTFTCTQDIAGCVNRKTVVINVKQHILPVIPVQTVCNNASATIGVTAVQGVSYTWTPSTGLSNATAATTTVSNVTNTTAYTLTAIDQYGCAATAQAIIGVNPTPAPTITVPDVTTSVGMPATAFNPVITPGAGTYTYNWTPANKVSDPYIINPVPTENKIGNTIYTLSVTDDNGCTSTKQVLLKVQSINVLPVTLASFTASPKNCGVTVNWKVESASNFSHFIVERSIAGGNFVAVKSIWYEYNRANYSFSDAEPGSGRWNYRLKMVDIDGRFTYSKVVTAEVKCAQQASLKVYPNPVSSFVYVSSSKPVKAVRLLSLTGSLLMTKEINQTSVGAVQIPVNNLIKGVYVLQVIAKDGTMQPAKLVKE